MRILNDNNGNLKFTYFYDDKQVPFLDLLIYKDVDGKISTTLCRKGTAGNTILRADKAHSKPLLMSIPYGQYLQLRRNCSSDFEFRKEDDLLHARLLEKGYSYRSLKRAFNKVINRNHQEFLFKTKPAKDNTITRFITKFNSGHQYIKNILSEYWYILSDNEQIAKFITPYPSTTYRRSTSIRDRLVHSAFQYNRLNLVFLLGLFKCGSCNICPWILEGQSFSLPNGSKHVLRQHISCETMGITYLLTCICGDYYVGKTKRQFQRQINDHLHDILVGRLNKPICLHVGLPHRYDRTTIPFRYLEHIPEPIHGGDRDAF